MKDRLKMILSKDIVDAITRAREDERKICNAERADEIEKQRRRIEGEYTLMLKEKQGEIDSLNIRMKELAGRERRVEDERQNLREQAMYIRRIMSDLKYLSEREREENIERGQTIDRLMGEVATASGRITE